MTEVAEIPVVGEVIEISVQEYDRLKGIYDTVDTRKKYHDLLKGVKGIKLSGSGKELKARYERYIGNNLTDDDKKGVEQDELKSKLRAVKGIKLNGSLVELRERVGRLERDELNDTDYIKKREIVKDLYRDKLKEYNDTHERKLKLNGSCKERYERMEREELLEEDYKKEREERKESDREKLIKSIRASGEKYRCDGSIEELRKRQERIENGEEEENDIKKEYRKKEVKKEEIKKEEIKEEVKEKVEVNEEGITISMMRTTLLKKKQEEGFKDIKIPYGKDSDEVLRELYKKVIGV